MTGWASQFFSIIGLQPTLISVLILYVAVITTAILYRFQTLKTSQIQYQYVAYLHRALYHAIISSEWLYFTRTKSSKFAHALTNEIERIGARTGQFLSLLAGLMILVVIYGLRTQNRWHDHGNHIHSRSSYPVNPPKKSQQIQDQGTGNNHHHPEALSFNHATLGWCENHQKLRYTGKKYTDLQHTKPRSSRKIPGNHQRLC
ncbi:MAG TPA: hypothetical protein VF324_06440 [Methanobacterium sp.]